VAQLLLVEDDAAIRGALIRALTERGHAVATSWLRRKLGETAQQPRYLHTVRGVGVKVSAPP
jgi:DNA-binding response OmpR family regulator